MKGGEVVALNKHVALIVRVERNMDMKGKEVKGEGGVNCRIVFMDCVDICI